jgi:hypothetical protein
MTTFQILVLGIDGSLDAKPYCACVLLVARNEVRVA